MDTPMMGPTPNSSQNESTAELSCPSIDLFKNISKKTKTGYIISFEDHSKLLNAMNREEIFFSILRN
jgi:hypothetical protein